jgi:hypothetical protein
MRRSRRLGLVAAIVLIVGGGGYTAFWFIVAGRIASGAGDWAQSLRAQNLELSWQTLAVGGFPLAFRVTLHEARLRGAAAGSDGAAAAPVISAAAWPWSLRRWRVAAPDGLSATAGPADKPAAALQARTAVGSVAFGADGGAAIHLLLLAPTVDASTRVAAQDADLRLTLPPHPPQQHTEPTLDFTLAAHQLSLPVVTAAFPNSIDEVALAASVMGPIPAGRPRQAAAAWRDGGGTIELRHFALRWGTLAIAASGTLALDRDLQPIGAVSGSVEGYEQLLAALVAAGRIRAGDAGLARLALAMLAKPGPDGRPEIATSFTIQDGQMFLGPVRLGRAPRVSWQ